MLILTRRPNEAIVMSGGITVIVLGVERNRVRIGIEAPKAIEVDRQEVQERKRRQATQTELAPAALIGDRGA